MATTTYEEALRVVEQLTLEEKALLAGGASCHGHANALHAM